jgi:predicted Fe-Mo cluster-binding NifX family protein
MLAIPLETEESTVISDLYGNAPYFAILDTSTGSFTVVENEVKGKGPKSAEFLKSQGVSSTIFYHMGEGVYQSFIKNEMEVYSSDYTYLTLDEIYTSFLDDSAIKLDENNYEKLLDPGNGGACTCGCEK